ncbi:MAG: hypothetical protein R3304_03535 [Longimicrobiales bacterium]|nr:hypothetical protein [Longimicrobiales bacterium]
MTIEVRSRRACITRAGVGAFAVLGLVLSWVRPDAAAAQSYRGWLSSSAHMVEVRPVGVDSVSAAQVTPDGDGGFLFDGYPVTCDDGVCSGLLPRSKVRTVTMTHDVGLTYWGLGVRGLSVTALVRVRSDFDDDYTWPRYDDEFDAMLGYAQLVRDGWRVRAGRQEVRSGLGLSAFDGVSGSFDRRRFRLEVYGGRSLARGLREPANEVARSLDDFFVDKGVYLVGGAATIRRLGASLTGRYHRQILSDRSGLDSERASVDFSTTLPRVRIRGSLDYDFAFQRLGQGDLTLSAPFADGRWLVEVSGRRYVPYFQLSTIWGFFEPVSYSEARLRVGWSGTSSLAVWAAGGWRTYGDTDTQVLRALEDTGWRADAGLLWEPFSRWSIDGRYQLEWGSGAFLNSGDVGMRFQATERVGARLSLSTFQQFEEYRLGEGRAVGVGGSVDVRATDRLDLLGGFSLTRHRDGGNVYTSPWNQTRAWMSLRWSVGEDPGLANRRSRR